MTDPRTQHHEPREDQAEQPVVRDKRRIDPTTGALREPARPAPGAPGAAAEPATGTPAPAEPAPAGQEEEAAAQVADLQAQLAERTTDLQRLQAEYVNYRRRVERDRESVREMALANVLTNLLPVLDDIGRARDHGELEGGFRKVAEAFESTVEKLGLTRFGAVGEPFDPTVHEALMHSYSSDVTEPTAVAILQPGYRLGERVLRPARVAVSEPGEPDGPAADE